MEDSGEIDYKKDGVCCCTGKPMHDSANLNFIETGYVPTWQFPVSCNLQYPEIKFAIAIVHDCALTTEGEFCGEIKHCIEFKDGQIIYHPVDRLAVWQAPVTNNQQ